MMIDKFSNKYEFLSNFYRSDIHFAGYLWPTLEHLFQASKTNDLDQRLTVLRAKTPGQAKRLGRKVALKNDWELVKDEVMLFCLRLKFYPSLDLANRLLATSNQVLIEGNTWHDNYWGNCTCVKCEDTPKTNKLGKLLMQVRREIRVML